MSFAFPYKNEALLFGVNVWVTYTRNMHYSWT